MKIDITSKHFREATFFISNTRCPLALAIKDIFPEGTYVGVGSNTVDIDEDIYGIESKWGRGEFTPTIITGMIQDAKQGIEVPTVTVTLTKY